MRFSLNDDQKQIQHLAREVIGADLGTLGTAAGSEAEERLWTSALELGWPGIAVSAEADGAGFGVIELGLLAEELGAGLAGSRLLLAATCATVVDRFGSPEQRDRLLPRLLEGSSRAGLVVHTPSTQPVVLGGEEADVVIAVGEGGASLVDASGSTAAALVDETRQYATLAPITTTETVGGATSRALDLVLAVASAEMLGVARRVMDLSVEHAKTREQFGRPIGTFQAVSHRCAEMFYAVETSRSVAYHALWATEHGSADAASSIALSLASDNATQVSASAIHLHGGMGFTWESPMHRFYKRALVNQIAWGTPAWHRRRVAASQVLARPAAS